MNTMYQGAKNTSQSGNGKSANPGKKRRRRPTKKKKNPSGLTWALIVGGAAAAVGGGVAYALHRKKKKKAAQQLPGQPGGPGTLPPSNGGKPSVPSAKKRDAPPFPWTKAELPAQEAVWVTTESGIVMLEGNVISESQIEDITNDAFYGVFPAMKGQVIPGKGKRGEGWQPYIDSWLRIRSDVTSKVNAFNADLGA